MTKLVIIDIQNINFVQTLTYFIDQIKSIYYFEIILTLKDSTNIRDMANIM